MIGDFMKLDKDEYIIVEIIPTKLSDGDIVEMTALRIKDLKLVDRFNYRLNRDKVMIKEFLEMCSYDDDTFTYLDDTKDIIDEFKKWSNELPLVVIDNTYTCNYLKDLNNKIELVFPYLELENNSEVIQNMIDKYKLEESNYLVDLVYEAIIRQF